MRLKIHSLASYVVYLINSGTRHSVHSPFVYKLVEEVLRNKRGYSAFRKINEIRQNLRKSSQLIEITELSRSRNNINISHRVKSIHSVARESSINEKYGRLLYRLVDYFKPETLIETGTSLGLSTMYLAMANASTKVYTIDACTIKSEQAAISFKTLDIDNIEQHIGLFEVVLPGLIRKMEKLDFAFVDGDYSYLETIADFETLLKISHNETVFVFSQIHSSSEMEKTWEQVANHEKVTVSIDLFGIGIVFLRKELSRQNFIIRF